MQRFFVASTQALEAFLHDGSDLPFGLHLAMHPGSVVLAADVWEAGSHVPQELSAEQQETQKRHKYPLYKDQPRNKSRGKASLARRLAWRVEMHEASGQPVCVPTGLLRAFRNCGIKGVPDEQLPLWLVHTDFAAMYVTYQVAEAQRKPPGSVRSVPKSPPPKQAREAPSSSRPKRAAKSSLQQAYMSPSSSDSGVRSGDSDSADSIVPQAQKREVAPRAQRGTKRALQASPRDLSRVSARKRIAIVDSDSDSDSGSDFPAARTATAAVRAKAAKPAPRPKRKNAAAAAVSSAVSASAAAAQSRDAASEGGGGLQLAAAISALHKFLEKDSSTKARHEAFTPLYRRVTAWMNLFFDDFEVSLLCQDAASVLDQLCQQQQELPGLLKGLSGTCMQPLNVANERSFAAFCLQRITALAPRTPPMLCD